MTYNTGVIPRDWKFANTVPIYKKGNKAEVSNYRPVSLTNVVCKVMESIIRDHVMEHFLKNDLFSNRQYGFLKGRSTVLQLKPNSITLAASKLVADLQRAEIWPII